MDGKKSNKTDGATKSMTLKEFRHHCMYYDACGFRDKYCHIHTRDCFRWKFASNVMERVKTFQDAVNELGDDNPLVQQFVCVCNIAFNNSGVKLDADIIAYLKLRIITAALNEGWEPQFTEDEYRYYPYFYLITKEEYEQLSDEDKVRCVGRSGSDAVAYGGLVYASAGSGSAYSSACDGVRLAFRTSKLAKYAGKQFLDIWADFVFKIGEPDKTSAE